MQSGSTALFSSANQSGWNGLQITISGDSSSGTYTIVSGYGKSWKISPAYGGSSNAVGAGFTLISPSPLSNITTITGAPTVKVQFGGTGSTHSVTANGPTWNPSNSPLAMWHLLCGPVDSIVVQNPGSGYSSSPSTTITGRRLDRDWRWELRLSRVA